MDSSGSEGNNQIRQVDTIRCACSQLGFQSSLDRLSCVSSASILDSLESGLLGVQGRGHTYVTTAASYAGYLLQIIMDWRNPSIYVQNCTGSG